MSGRKFYKIVGLICFFLLIIAVVLAIQENGFLGVVIVVGIIYSAYKLGLGEKGSYRDTTHSLTEY